MKLPTYEELDLLVDTDPIRLRDVAWELVRKLQSVSPAPDNWLQLEEPDQVPG